MGCVAGYASLNSQRDFSTVYSQAKKWYNEICIVFYLPGEHRRIAVVASKKVGKAVARNRAKRVLRASFSCFADELRPGVYILVAKSGVESFNLSIATKNMRWSFKKLGCLK
ncbi:ribonuclease P protein component [Campylobacter sp. 19-13652]|uniref:ribonuclease P protein component n=1 Tax=Campylobacter sp. 19-13652 TaxID=2840180 RepID=UPI001C842A58|nr:ribonuclease P protein component [Campylobacter sp. 19-13652]